MRPACSGGRVLRVSARRPERTTPYAPRTREGKRDSRAVRTAGLPLLQSGNVAVGRMLRATSLARAIGVEVEFSGSAAKGGPKTGDAPDWEKRDVIYQGATWDATLDDTPGPGTEAAAAFNLEFILGGANRRGFDDSDVERLVSDLKTAVGEIRSWVNEQKGGFDMPPRTTSDGKQHWVTGRSEPRCRPLQVKPQAFQGDQNVQLTSGLSLVGLYELIKGATLIDDDAPVAPSSAGPHEADLRHLLSPTDTKRLASSDRRVDEAAVQGALTATHEPQLPERAAQAIAALLTLLRNFLGNYSEGSVNSKQATPILWKTPLDEVFAAPDLKDAANWPRLWPKLVEQIIPADSLAKKLKHPPTAEGETRTGRAWLFALPRDGDWLKRQDDAWLTEKQTPDSTLTGWRAKDEPKRVKAFGDDLSAAAGYSAEANAAGRSSDWLTNQDKLYDKSYGGLGKLEGGAGPSKGQPIFEFRSFPNTLSSLERALENAARTLDAANRA